MTPNINTLLVRSNPLDHNLKRYFIMKYRHLVEHNGVEYANDKFKAILYHCQSYLSGERSIPLPIRRTGWVKKLYGYLGSNPEWVLSFFKLYSWTGKPDIPKAARETVELLNSIRSPSPTPRFINEYIEVLDAPLYVKDIYYDIHRDFPHSMFHKYCKHHTRGEWMQYWKQAHNRWSKGKVHRHASTPTPFPEVYKTNGQEQFEEDYYYFIRFVALNSALPRKAKDHLIDLMSPAAKDDFGRAMQHQYGRITPESVRRTRRPFGTHAGQIHFIPKGGNGFRPIAVPNRFLQEGMAQAHYELVSVLEKFGDRDATYDQGCFDNVIQSRVNTDDRYIGSVDLSSATDRLPLDWFRSVEHRLDLHPGSWQLFLTCSRSVWNADGLHASWRVGQPLGTLPSFQVLGLTQHLILEALSLSEGYGHRPYRVLGDDVVIFSKRLRNRYIIELSKRNVDISFHKSYSGKFSQFAGKNYVKNGKPFLNPDHNMITPNALFDYQISTGIRIKWRNLPKFLRKGWSHRQYNLVQEALVHPLGRGKYPGVPDHMSEDLVSFFSLLFSDKDEAPSPERSLGFVQLMGSEPTVLSRQELKRDGLFTRYRETKLPLWFKRKFRPYEVMHLLDLAKQVST
jgi:hypothetical protein